jgi:uncharacterized protein
VMVCEWDEAKAQSNLSKHGVSFEEAASVFEDYFALTIDDPEHSYSEDRYITIGVSQLNRTLVVVNTQRIENVRVISARKANPSERAYYAKQF